MSRKPRKRKYGTATIIGGNAANAANLERTVCNGSLGKSSCAAFDTRVRITVMSYRTTLADADGISAKAAIDGLVRARIIADDSVKYVEEVRYRQIKVETIEEEKTILEIVSVGPI
jgi:hypothetical protein